MRAELSIWHFKLTVTHFTAETCVAGPSPEHFTLGLAILDF